MNKNIVKFAKRLKGLFAKDADELRIRKLRNLYYNLNVHVNRFKSSRVQGVQDLNIPDGKTSGTGKEAPLTLASETPGAEAAGTVAVETPAEPGCWAPGFYRMRGLRCLWVTMVKLKEALKEYEDACYLR